MVHVRGARTGAVAAGLLAFAICGRSLAQEAVPEAAAPAAPPRLELESDTAELGEVLRGDEVETAFVIRNTGGQPLKILKAKPG